MGPRRLEPIRRRLSGSSDMRWRREVEVDFPACPALGIDSRSFRFDYARSTAMHAAVTERPWGYEPDTLATVVSVLAVDRSSLFIDVGAHIGYFPIVASGLLPDVRCIAYEPTPTLAALIRRGARLNDVSVDVRTAAVGSERGRATLYLSAQSEASNSLNAGFRAHRSALDVEVTTIDHDFASDRSVDGRRPVMLIDTETTEPDVLRGAAEFVDRHRPAIVTEVLHDRTETELTEIFSSWSYDSYAFSGDSLVRRDTIVGDPTYAHRDWLFWPGESEPPIAEIEETWSVMRRAARRVTIPSRPTRILGRS